MADLSESNEWTTGIYQLETSDPVLGGPEGIDNLQAKQLANRTRWLKDKTDSLSVSLAGKAGKATTLGGYGITDAFTKPEATSAIQQAIASLVASSPAALDTLKELADALGNDPNFATTMTNALAGKAGKATTLGGYGITDALTKPETAAAIQQAIASLVASSPSALDTLKELADALGNDPNFATTMTNALAGKASKATTLAGYGITDAYTKSVSYTRAEVDALLKNLSALPVGAMVPFPKGTVPAGFLEIDGSVQSAATFPDLADYLGTTFNRGDEGAGNFRLPESRGEFLRGWDHNRGVDPGRVLGTYQADDFKSHFHAAPNSDAAGGVVGSWLYAELGNAATNYENITKNSGGSETRPRNLAVMWCIKAWGAPVNQGNIDIAGLAAQVVGFSARAAALEERPRGIGDGQTWQNVTASRVSGTVYTNTTGRPIMVQLSFTTGGVYTVVDGVNLTVSAYHSAFIVPAGSTYKITYGSAPNLCWTELR